ncbi:EpsG family protein [Psychrobacter sp. ANT_H59]|uniref:EpsG family protein n=1 Tax=Psychrobacter sp. ANT_H59 TaxID=2597354 RepID=UPI0011EC362F|nr:EpsG family protein [Psychrobacter sp. ANT_H59]KAA0933452.1 EpsG family protein [Psychrobacter sp. ANT_H59]
MNGIFVIFLILVLFSLLESTNLSNNIKSFLWFIASVLVLFTLGLGYKVGVDWVAYQENYYHNNFESFEALYSALSVFSASLGMNFWFFAIAIKSINTLLLLVIFKRYTKLPLLAVTIFFALTYPYINDVLRQVLASIVLLSSFLIIKRYPSIFSIVIASSFHISSLVLLLGKLSFFKRSTKKFTLILVLGSLATGSLFIGFLTSGVFSSFNYLAISKLQMYAEDSKVANLYSSLVRISIFALALYSQFKIKIIHSKVDDWVYRATLLMLLIEILTISIPLISQRVRIYFLPFVCIALANGIYKLPKGVKTITIGYILSYCSIFLYLFTTGVFGNFYQLDMNIIIQFIKGFPSNNWESAAFNFWNYR